MTQNFYKDCIQINLTRIALVYNKKINFVSGENSVLGYLKDQLPSL